MTRDEAIAHGKEQLEIFGGTHREFIRMAIEALERKHGEWIYGESELGNDGYYCSKCGNFIPWVYKEFDIDFIKEFKFCPNCGADMRGGNNDGR